MTIILGMEHIMPKSSWDTKRPDAIKKGGANQPKALFISLGSGLQRDFETGFKFLDELNASGYQVSVLSVDGNDEGLLVEQSNNDSTVSDVKRVAVYLDSRKEVLDSFINEHTTQLGSYKKIIICDGISYDKNGIASSLKRLIEDRTNETASDVISFKYISPICRDPNLNNQALSRLPGLYYKQFIADNHDELVSLFSCDKAKAEKIVKGFDKNSRNIEDPFRFLHTIVKGIPEKVISKQNKIEYLAILNRYTLRAITESVIDSNYTKKAKLKVR